MESVLERNRDRGVAKRDVDATPLNSKFEANLLGSLTLTECERP